MPCRPTAAASAAARGTAAMLLAALLLLLLMLLAAPGGPAHAADAPGPMASSTTSAPTAAADAPIDVQKLFANTCGWCHAGAGRVAGKGPQLMGTSLTDAEITTRIKTGKVGAMPGFGGAFTEAQLTAIVAYIRGLKPDGAAP